MGAWQQPAHPQSRPAPRSARGRSGTSPRAARCGSLGGWMCAEWELADRFGPERFWEPLGNVGLAEVAIVLLVPKDWRGGPGQIRQLVRWRSHYVLEGCSTLRGGGGRCLGPDAVGISRSE